MIRVGIVDFDTSHVVAFTQILNHVDVSPDLWVDGARVVAGIPGTSLVSPERVDGYAEQLRGYGVELVETPEELIDKIDAVCIESNDGSVHLDRARPFIEAGIPTFVDKPFACSLQHAREIAAIAAAADVPLFSASSLRYAPDVVEVASQASELGSVVGADVLTPAALHPRNPGLFHYGIHGVEVLFALMGPGCAGVQAVSAEGVDVAVGRWRDGRIGTVRGIRDGQTAFGFTAICENRVVQKVISGTSLYLDLLEHVTRMFETGVPPLDISETLQIVAFIEAALESSRSDGRNVALPH